PGGGSSGTGWPNGAAGARYNGRAAIADRCERFLPIDPAGDGHRMVAVAWTTTPAYTCGQWSGCW
ncbi:MAG: hypothetical protein J2P17_34160, partial [Mycobacterium sp.]|nr:hypothetical protein [Mycobacterium sp.]